MRKVFSNKSMCNYKKGLSATIIVGCVVSVFLYSRVVLFEDDVSWHKRHLADKCNTKIFLKAKVHLNGRYTNISIKTPACANILKNITAGGWKLRKNYDKNVEVELNLLLASFRKQIGKPDTLWRADGKCGYEEPIKGSSTICNPMTNLSCCTDLRSGVCVASDSSECGCKQCLDSKKLIHADLADWITTDSRCHWQKYSACEGYTVLNSLASQHAGILSDASSQFYFVGDSLVHNTYLGLLILLTGRKNTGTWKRCLTDELQSLCWGQHQFLWMPCLAVAVADSLDEADSGTGCVGQKRYFKVIFKAFFSSLFGKSLLKLIQDLLHQQNSYITLGVGLLDNLKSKTVLGAYLKPAVELLRQNNASWPKLLWMHPLTIGAITPKHFWGGRGGEGLADFIREVDSYLKEEDIPSFDFRNLTSYIHSHDGTHYGRAVNLMKAQIWLNYMASLT